MKFIHLTRGKITAVDDEDFEWLSQWKWSAHRVKKKSQVLWYAKRTEGHRGPTIFMHRQIMDRIQGGSEVGKYIVDHRDGDGLNNVRQNLRSCSYSQNFGNSKKTRGTVSKFKGVAWHRRDEVWVSSITCNGKSYWLGTFDSEQAAAKAYDEAAQEHFGEFARLNFS